MSPASRRDAEAYIPVQRGTTARVSPLRCRDSHARDSDDPWIRHHHRLIELGGGPVVLGTMYDNLLEAVRLCPGAVVVASAVGAVQQTYELLVDALREPGSR
jgi:hypothetical protein